MRSKFIPEQDKKIAALYLSGKTSRQIANFFNVYPQTILRSLNRTDTPKRKDWKRASGEKNGNWRGGIRLIKGYRHIYKPGHWLARNDGWVAEHRFLMEKFIIKKTQVVHHKDGNILNNMISNLEIFTSNGVHRHLHSKNQPRGKDGRYAQLSTQTAGKRLSVAEFGDCG